MKLFWLIMALGGVLSAILVFLMSFLPGGTSTNPQDRSPQDLVKFDCASPGATQEQRKCFVDALEAQVDGNYARAQQLYSQLPNNEVVAHNLSLMPKEL